MKSICRYLGYTARLSFFIISNLYALPCYVIWMTLLTPLRFLAPNVYWKMESYMFKMLQCMVVTWLSWFGGYRVLECGDDIGKLHNSEAIILCNHQSTADTPIVMLASHNKGMAAGTTMWIMYVLFKYTNFGLVSWHREDFFIDQGKDVRDLQLTKLKAHLLKSYLPHNRKWIVVFPEGGFLYKRLESSQSYAKKYGHPVLKHATLPRIGAIKTILDTNGEPYAPASSVSINNDEIVKNVDQNHQIQDPRPLKWVVDITLAYKDGKALDMLGMCIGYNPHNDVLLHYRAYRARDIPRDETALTQWLYDRYREKDEILEHYYKEGQFSEQALSEQRVLPHIPLSYLKFDKIKQILIHTFFVTSCYVHYVYIVKPMFDIFHLMKNFVF